MIPLSFIIAQEFVKFAFAVMTCSIKFHLVQPEMRFLAGSYIHRAFIHVMTSYQTKGRLKLPSSLMRMKMSRKLNNSGLNLAGP